MELSPDTPPEKKATQSLDDHILRYDFDEMLADAESEFDSALSTRELIDQSSIAKLFNIDGKNDHERN